MRLIDADALKKKIEFFKSGHNVGTDYENGIIDGYDFCLDEIDNAPTVDTGDSKYLEERDADAWESGYIQGLSEQRPQGKWVYESGTVNSFFRCSNCGRFNPHDIFVKENDDRYTRLEREDANRFCWHCGADMRGKE